MNNVFGRIQPVFEWIINLASLNITWLVFIFPIAYLSILLVLVEHTSQVLMIVLTIVVLSPFLLFPATTAMFGVVRKWFMKEEIQIVKSFWRFYKENYKRSLSGGLILSFLWLVGVVDFLYMKSDVSFVNYIVLFILAFLLLYTLYFLSDTVHTESKLTQSLKNVLIITVANPIFSFGIVLICIFILYVSFTYLPFLIILFTGPFIAILGFYGYQKVFTTILNVQK
ncbi:YesL family protein [Neobacillus sp. NPDC093182]|uniref:YesL family protein n=1 Tax=Neobacillus sp. NPDC093182 TaxID=3364297 RepID=UPI0037F5F591